MAACGGAETTTTTTGDAAPSTTTLAPADGATTTAAPPAAAPAGLALYAGDGFAMLMPESWTIAGFGDIELQAVLDELSAAGLGQLIPAIEGAFDEGGKLFAFDFANATEEFTDNINILQLEHPGTGAAELIDIARADIEQIGATNTAARVEQLPAGETIIVTYDLPPALGGGQGVSYTVLTADSQWVITYTARDAEPFLPAFEQMMESFREQ